MVKRTIEVLGSMSHPSELYDRYLLEQAAGKLVVLVAFDGDALAGYLTVQWQSNYAPFHADGIPETRDFNVFPSFRRRRIGTRLMDEAERRIAERSEVAGIGVGLTPDYGAAQHMYAIRSYVPDGRGVARRGVSIQPGQEVALNDEVVMYMTKLLR